MDSIQDDSVPMPSQEAASTLVAVPKQQRGYPLSIIPNGKADEKFCCGYCKLILRNPMQSSCGHRYCQDCLKVMQSLPQPLQCQPCVEEGITDESSMLDFQEIFEDKAARREMRKLQVKCVSASCPWKGSFNDFVEHEENCDRKMVSCSQCGTSVNKGRLLNHETKSCPKRMIHCNYCREEIVYENKEKHNEECPKYLLRCEKCHTPVERFKILEHQETLCANRVITCPLPDCNAKRPLEKFLAHICKDEVLSKHIFYLLDKLGIFDQKLQNLEKRISHQYADASPPSKENPPASDTVDALNMVSGASAEVSERTQGDGAQAEGLVHEDRQKLKLHEDLMSVLHSEILRCITKGEALGRGQEKSDNRLRDCYAKIEAMVARLTQLEQRVDQVAPRPFSDTECGDLIVEGNGLYTWIIKGYSQVKRDATQQERIMVCSPTFFTCAGGYKLRLKLYANGEGRENTGKNVSLFLQIVKGENDDLLVWPFAPKVHFMLVDQVDFQQHHVKVYQADPVSPVSCRPTEDTSVAAGCPAFISVQDMNQKMPLYWPKDIVYLKFHIETPQKNLDRLKTLNPLGQPASEASAKSYLSVAD